LERFETRFAASAAHVEGIMRYLSVLAVFLYAPMMPVAHFRQVLL
jgi:hypothetical protein